MGRFIEKSYTDGIERVYYNEVLKALCIFLDGKYNLKFSYSINNKSEGLREYLEIILKENETNNVIIDTKKNVSAKELAMFLRTKNYKGELSNFMIDINSILTVVPGVNDFLDRLFNNYNESREPLEVLVQRISNPGSISLSDVITMNEETNTPSLNTNNFFEFLVAFINEIEKEKYHYTTSEEPQKTANNNDHGTGNYRYKLYNIIGENGFHYKYRTLTSYADYDHGLITMMHDNLDENMTLQDALSIIATLKANFPYMDKLYETISENKTSFTVKELAKTAKVGRL